MRAIERNGVDGAGDTCVPSHPINRCPTDGSSRLLAIFPSKKGSFIFNMWEETWNAARENVAVWMGDKSRRAGALKWAGGSDLRQTAGRHSLKLISVPGGRSSIHSERKAYQAVIIGDKMDG